MAGIYLGLLCFHQHTSVRRPTPIQYFWMCVVFFTEILKNGKNVLLQDSVDVLSGAMRHLFQVTDVHDAVRES